MEKQFYTILEFLEKFKELDVKVILNEDVKHLGEEGDVKVVANGYARNFLLPRGLALPYSAETVAYFESRREEIEARKEEKRQNARSIKERLEDLHIHIGVSAGPNGKLYGSVTSQSIVDELAKLGFNDIERKRVEVPGNTIKSAGKYEVIVKLYEKEFASIPLTVEAQIPEAEKTSKDRKPRTNKETTTVEESKVSDEADEASSNKEEASAEA